jgi:flavine halogenase
VKFSSIRKHNLSVDISHSVDETGWAWFIPLHDGTTSVGVVSNQAELNAKKARRKEKGEDVSSQGQFLSDLKLTPSVMDLIGDGKLIKKASDIPVISSASDYSYTASRYAGKRFRIVGDAAGTYPLLW